MIVDLAGWSSLWVSVCYLIIGGLIVPNLRFPWPATLLAGAFFVGCAFTHAHIFADTFATHGHIAGEQMMPPMDAWIMLILHIVQGIGGTGFIIAISRKKLVVRLER